MNELEMNPYLEKFNNEALFEEFKSSLDPERILHIGYAKKDGTLGERSVAVKDADRSDLNIFYAQYCSKIAFAKE